jgi:PKD domain
MSAQTIRRMVILLVTTSLALTMGAEVAQAAVADPPITTPPPASETQPPTEAIIDSVDPITPCSGWYLQNAYGATWSTDSTWWEYSCERVGAAEPEGPFQTDYYYWDSAQARSTYYGQRTLTWDWWFGTGFCLTWWDHATNQAYGPYWCALSTTPPTASLTVSCSGPSCDFDASASTDSDGTIQYYYWDFGDGTVISIDATTATHVYPGAGTFAVQLVVVDNDGAEAGDIQAITVGPNALP